MRWLTLLLLTLNLVIFAFYWQSQQQQAQLLQRQQRLPDAPRLRLLSEVDALQERRDEAAAESVLSVAVASTSADEAVLSSAVASTAVSAAISESELTAVQGQASIDAAASVEKNQAVSVAIVSPSVVATPAPVEPAAEELVVTACLSLAYFDSREAAEAVAFGGEVVKQDVVEERQWLPSDYWVYIPDPGTSALRRNMRKELSDMGFENYWIQRGYLKGQLSLGLYRNQDSAQALMHLLQDRGFMPRIYENTRYSARYLVEIEVQSTEKGVAELRSALQRRYADIKTEKKPCQGLASLELAE